MDLIRDWLIGIAGMVVFGALCEMIMPSGDIKKYVRIVLGMLLVFTVAKPISAFRIDSAPDLGLPSGKAGAYALHEKADSEQRSQVMRLYTEKLKEKVINSAESEGGRSIENVDIKVAMSKENFGEVEEISVILDGKTDKGVADSVRNRISQDYGVKDKNVQVAFAQNRGGK